MISEVPVRRIVRLEPTRIVETHSGWILCDVCPAGLGASCDHVLEVLRAGIDRRGRFDDALLPLPPRVGVPILGAKAPHGTLEVPVVADPPDEHLMQHVSVGITMSHPWSLGYVGPAEGRWVIRDLVVEWLASRPGRSECGVGGCNHIPWAKRSHLGLRDQWSRVSIGQCLRHAGWREPDHDDLLPDV